MAADKPNVAHYVQGTHWDREWYLPFQHFRARLVRILDRLLDIMERRDDVRTFFLDGQTAMVEDYLAVRPENGERLLALVRAGRVQVGPWFVMPDEFLPSGEALVRNLLLGCRQASEMGGEPMRVGYICDMFGQNSQFPQILKGFGIDSAVFFRGISDDIQPLPYRWAAADGSTVLALKLPDHHGYGMLMGRVHARCMKDDQPLDLDADARAVVEVAEGERRRTGLDTVLILDAHDHQPPSEELADVLARSNETADGWEFRWSTFEEFLSDVRDRADKWPVVRGELRSPAKRGGNVLLQNVFSSRVPLKQANARCQTLLECWAEPLAALASPLGYDGGRTSIALAWKYLLLNHPHDSICGCSLDQVHEDMVYRFDQSRLLAEIVRRDAAEAVARKVRVDRDGFDMVVQVWNPLASARDDSVDLELSLPDREAGYLGTHDQMRFQTFALVDETGAEVPYQKLRDGGRRPAPYAGLDGGPRFESRTPVEVAVRLHLPPCGYRTLRMQWLPERRLAGGTMSPAPGVMENEHLRVEIQANGTWDLTDKRCGAVYRGLGLLENMADIGDGWNHFIPTADEVHTTVAAAASVAKVADGREKVTYRITHRLRLPERFDVLAQERSAERCELEVATDVTLRRGGCAVECRTRVENVVRDHALRVLLPTDLEVNESLADTPFDVVRRPVALRDPAEWREPEQEMKPMAAFIGAHDGSRGLFVTTEGLHEAGLRHDERRTLAVTLLRGFPRNWNAAVRDQIGGEVLGEVALRWQVVPVAGPFDAAAMVRQARKLTSGVYVHLARWADDDASLPASQSFMEMADGRLTVTALKESEGGGTGALRAVNLGDTAVKDRVRFAGPVARWRQVTLEEQPEGEWRQAKDGWVPLEAGPRQIVTVEIEWA